MIQCHRYGVLGTRLEINTAVSLMQNRNSFIFAKLITRYGRLCRKINALLSSCKMQSFCGFFVSKKYYDPYVMCNG